MHFINKLRNCTAGFAKNLATSVTFMSVQRGKVHALTICLPTKYCLLYGELPPFQ